MPQYQEQKKGKSKVKVLPADSMRAYLLLMQKTGGRMQALPGDIFVIDEIHLKTLTENGIDYEIVPTH